MPTPTAPELLRAILESPPGMVIFALDREYRYLAFNENHRRTMAAIWDAEIALGRSMLEYLSRDDDRDKARRNFDRGLAGERFTLSESYGDERLGRRTYEDRYAPIVVEGEVVGVACYVTDITVAHERLLHAQKLESLGLMAAGVAHDFNNLLTGMLTWAELALIELPPEAPGRDRIARIEQAATQAAALTRQLLAYAGQVPPAKGPVEVSWLVRETEALVRASTPRNVELQLHLGADLPAVSADRTQLQQVLVNLVLNAAEAIGERTGRVEVTTSVRELDRAELAGMYVDDDLPAGPYVVVSVRDDGPGIDPAVLPRLFDPFFSTKFAGRGLGLASVLGIVRNHGGAVRVRSVPGRGATFEVLLPVMGPQVVVRPAPSRAGAGTVLLVDDEAPVREIAAEVLARLGFEVLEAGDGQAGVELLERHRDQISVVMLDMTMPRLDGEAAFRRVRAVAPEVPVVVASGWTREHRRLRFLADEAKVTFLAKPFRIAELEQALRTVLGPA